MAGIRFVGAVAVVAIMDAMVKVSVSAVGVGEVFVLVEFVPPIQQSAMKPLVECERAINFE
jgi:hypothetical protein